MTADFILGPQLPISNSWLDQVLISKGKLHGQAYPAEPPTGIELDPYILNNYYDLGLGLYIAHKRTGDPAFLTLARKVADSWYKGPHIGAGIVRTFDSFTHTPRNASLGGLILRALDGRSEMWDWLNAYTRYQFDNWVKSRINDPQLYLGARDGAFMLQYATWLAKVLPDSFPKQAGGTETNGAGLRAQYLADVEKVSTDYFGRLQYPDGSWRWDDPYSPDPDRGITLKGIMQPFMVGLVQQALIDVHRLTTNSAVKANIEAQLFSSCRLLYSGGPYTRLVVFGVEIRGFHYFFGGGTTVEPTKYVGGDLTLTTMTERGYISNARQAISTILPAFGYAFSLSGDTYYKDAANEMFDSAYGGGDGYKSYLDGDAKSYNQHARGVSKFLAWMGSALTQPTSTPAPAPAPAPAPSPTPSTPAVESPNNTRIPTASQIVDSTGAIWTFTTNGIILRNGQGTGGQGSVLLYCNRIVYAFGTDSQWYKWGNGWTAVGVVDPCASVTPTPTPTPTPVPAPTTPALRKVEWPSGEAKQNAILDTQWKDRYRFKRHLSGAYAEFEKVP